MFVLSLTVLYIVCCFGSVASFERFIKIFNTVFIFLNKFCGARWPVAQVCMERARAVSMDKMDNFACEQILNSRAQKSTRCHTEVSGQRL